MSTNRGISRNPLPSSRFHYISKPEKNVTLGFECEIHTRTLTTPYLSPSRISRLEIIEKLNQQGLTDKQISDWFNDLGFVTPQEKRYTPSLVWVTRKKWTDRALRENDTHYVIYPPKFYLVERTKKFDANPRVSLRPRRKGNGTQSENIKET